MDFFKGGKAPFATRYQYPCLGTSDQHRRASVVSFKAIDFRKLSPLT